MNAGEQMKEGKWQLGLKCYCTREKVFKMSQDKGVGSEFTLDQSFQRYTDSSGRCRFIANIENLLSVRRSDKCRLDLSYAVVTAIGIDSFRNQVYSEEVTKVVKNYLKLF